MRHCSSKDNQKQQYVFANTHQHACCVHIRMRMRQHLCIGMLIAQCSANLSNHDGDRRAHIFACNLCAVTAVCCQC